VVANLQFVSNKEEKMETNCITFTDVVELAKFVAELERLGICYYVHTGDHEYTVSIKGF